MLPTWPALYGHGRPLGALDLAAFGVTAAGIAVEAIADDYISVTPLHFDLTHEASLAALTEAFR